MKRNGEERKEKEKRDMKDTFLLVLGARGTALRDRP